MFSCAAAFAADGLLDAQRQAFREAYAAAELGDWAPAAARRDLLEPYVLWPDLRAAWLKTRLRTVDRAELDAFLDRYAALKPARELRYRLAIHLASTKHFGEFLSLYDSFYRGLGIARLDCLAVRAEILRGDAAKIVDQATALWLVGHSQADECDPVFDYLRGAGLLDATLYRQRYELALSDRQYSLARYLARSLDEASFEGADRWLRLQRDPQGFLDASLRSSSSSAADNDRIVAALEQIARTDAPRADSDWAAARRQRTFDHAQVEQVSRHIALWRARQHDPAALEHLDELPAETVDDEVRRWRVRAALAQEAWPEVGAAIRAMPDGQRDAEEWQYWLAVAGTQTGDKTSARRILERLSTGRSYYGFLAADALDRDYAYGHATIEPDDEVLQKLEAMPPLIRARELFHVGLESRGRSEWDDALALLGADEKVQAAILAHRWGWHSRAIATVANAGRFDDLEIRYPLAYADEFTAASASASIPDSWAYGVARSESLFIPDIRSRSGAIGIMQLLPATGRSTAGELNLPYEGLPTLTDPLSNIRIGTTYLGKMLRRFGDNRVVATAAYNAGPSRVEEWLPAARYLDARIWIENIPYNQTRDYVRRVLVSDAIFNWRLTGHTRRLSDELGQISPAAQQLASSKTHGAAAGCQAKDAAGC